MSACIPLDFVQVSSSSSSSSSGTSVKSKLLLALLCYEDDSFTILLRY